MVALSGGRAGSCSASPVEGWMQSPKSLCVDSSHQQLWRFSSDLGKVHARGMSWGREVSPAVCAGIECRLFPNSQPPTAALRRLPAMCQPKDRLAQLVIPGGPRTGLSQRQKQLEW